MSETTPRVSERNDAIDVIFGLRDLAATTADQLRPAVAEAQAVLDRLDKLASFYEDAAQLVAASDLAPDSSARIPDTAGLVRSGASS